MIKAEVQFESQSTKFSDTRSTTTSEAVHVKDVGADRKVWIFNAHETKEPGGVFAFRRLAELWVARAKLTGNLTQYPLDVGVYDQALEIGKLDLG